MKFEGFSYLKSISSLGTFVAKYRKVIVTCNWVPAIASGLPVKEETCFHPFACFLGEKTVANGNPVNLFSIKAQGKAMESPT